MQKYRTDSKQGFDSSVVDLPEDAPVVIRSDLWGGSWVAGTLAKSYPESVTAGQVVPTALIVVAGNVQTVGLWRVHQLADFTPGEYAVNKEPGSRTWSGQIVHPIDPEVQDGRRKSRPDWNPETNMTDGEERAKAINDLRNLLSGPGHIEAQRESGMDEAEIRSELARLVGEQDIFCGCESSLCDHNGICAREVDPRIRMEYVGSTCTQCAANMGATGGQSYLFLAPDEDPEPEASQPQMDDLADAAYEKEGNR